MIALLLAANILSCADGAWILEGLVETDLPTPAKNDMIQSVMESMPDDCSAEDYEDRRQFGT